MRLSTTCRFRINHIKNGLDLPSTEGYSVLLYILTAREGGLGPSWIEKTTEAFTTQALTWSWPNDVASTERQYPTLTRDLAGPGFFGSHNGEARCTDAQKAVIQPCDDSIDAGVSFVSGRASTVVGFALTLVALSKLCGR